MSTRPSEEPKTSTGAEGLVIDARSRDIAGFSVRRILPSRARRTVGPFIYLDHMGPSPIAVGGGIDVPPHPHIGLATVTYLFDGVIDHRDSLGSFQPIRPGEVNWMNAGRGIVHSERSPAEARTGAARLHGLQFWVALPKSHEESAPWFRHYDAAAIPERDANGSRIRVIAGTAFGLASPVETSSPLFLADIAMTAGSELEIAADHEERAVYVVEGSLTCGRERLEPGRMLVLGSERPSLRAGSAAHVVQLGGAPFPEPRYIDWNFVSSSQDRLARARRDWKEGRFPAVPGDAGPPLPLPG